MSKLDALKADLEGIRMTDNPGVIKQKSRDFYWYSPLLKEQLEAVRADLIVTPKDEAEVIRVLRAAHAHAIPVTARGGGTGNYGQCMPLAGGIVLDMTLMSAVREIAHGRVVAEPGILMGELDRQLREDSRQELRFFPSTVAAATIGGFVGGGLGGVGSVTWGTLREPGNIIRLRIVTMEAEPRIIELTGSDIQKVSHAYGTNGIITEVEMPLAPAYDWVEVLLGHESFVRGLRFGDQVGRCSGVLLKELGVVSAPAPDDYFTRYKPFLNEGQSVTIAMVAPQSIGAFLSIAGEHGAEVRYRSDKVENRKGLPPVYEFSWNHTTLRAMKVEKGLTYLQVLYGGADQIETLARVDSMFPGEVINHVEFMRFGGELRCIGLPIVRHSSIERLEELMRLHEANECTVFNPHRYTLEEGGMKETDPEQLAFKRQTDPSGLLNPGKMVAWDDPDYDFASGRVYLFPGLPRKRR